MTHYDIFNYKGVSESREVARGPKDPPPGVIGLTWYKITSNNPHPFETMGPLVG